MTNKEHPSFVTVTHGMRGMFCVLMVWCDEGNGFYEPWTSSDETFKSHESADKYGRAWAKDEGVEFR